MSARDQACMLGYILLSQIYLFWGPMVPRRAKSRPVPPTPRGKWRPSLSGRIPADTCAGKIAKLTLSQLFHPPPSSLCSPLSLPGTQLGGTSSRLAAPRALPDVMPHRPHTASVPSVPSTAPLTSGGGFPTSGIILAHVSLFLASSFQRPTSLHFLFPGTDPPVINSADNEEREKPGRARPVVG